MSANSIFQYLIPKDRKFYPLFEEASANLVAIAKVLVEGLSAPTMEKRIPFIRKIEKLEHVGDDITHRIFQEVGATFITPFDREDIQRLASVLDDILDYIHGVAKRIEFHPEEPDSEAIKAAAQHGGTRFDQGYSIPLIVQEAVVVAP